MIYINLRPHDSNAWVSERLVFYVPVDHQDKCKKTEVLMFYFQ